MTSAQLINQTSGAVEYYTPEPIIEAARRTMGAIDLDPASSEEANKRVKAFRFYSARDNGLTREWRGKIWLNHPFGRLTNRAWITKLLFETKEGRAIQWCCITYACTSEQWFVPLLEYPQCFLKPRTNYILPDGSTKRGVTKGSVVTYFGPDIEAFRREFHTLGAVKV